MTNKTLISSGSPFEKEMGYSRAVAQGNWCFVSGTTGYDYETMTMPEDVAEQAKNCFGTIIKALEEAGFDLSDTVRVQYTLPNRDDVEDVIPVLGAFLGDIRPAATMVIADLIKPEMKIEIEVTALRG